jgi:hypothetical protein
VEEADQPVETAPARTTLKLAGLTSSDPAARQRDAETVARALADIDARRDSARGSRK